MNATLDTLSARDVLSTHQDPRNLHDDPLLDSLLVLCQLYGKPSSREALTAGLPLNEHGLTLDTLPRAAGRAGLNARVMKRPLAKISPLSLPAILLLKEGNTAVLTKVDEQGFAHIRPTESEGSERVLPLSELETHYAGMVIFAQPHHSHAQPANALLPRTRTWFRDTLKLSRFLYVDAVIASLLINLIALGTPLFTMNVYDRVVPNQAIPTLWVLAAGISIAFVFNLLLKIMRGVCLDMAGKKTDLIVSATLFERVLGMSMKHRPARTATFAQNIHEFQSLRDFLSSLTLTTIIDLPFTLLMIFIIGLIGGTLAWIPFLVIPFALTVSWLIQRPLNATIEKTMSLSSERQALLSETLNSLETMKTNNMESERQYQWEQTLGSLSHLELRVKLLSYLATNLTEWFQQIAGVVMIIAGVYLIGDGQLSMGGLIACYMLNGRALAPLGQLSGLVSRYQQARLTIKNTDQMMALPQEREAHVQPLKRESFHGGIEFRDVNFSYPEQKNSSLQNISLTIKPGERIGIIGRSGSGKSSLSKLIVNLYTPSSGNILIDGVDARQLDVADLRHNIGYVPQDIQLVSGTLMDNLVCGARYIDHETMLRAATAAGVNDFASLHPDGYNLQVGERGSRLSGGQRQAVVLARALLLSPKILLLDEPTSSMDNTSEERVRQSLLPLIQNKTLLLVTHRASMLALVDRLIIVERGKIVADGPKAIVMDALKKGQINATH